MKNKQAEIYRNIAKGFNDLANLLENEGANTDNVPAERSTPVNRKTGATAPEKEEKKEVKGTLSKETLDAMKYNDLKKFAKEMGVDPTGTRDAITERLLGVEVSVEEEEDKAGEEEIVDLHAQVEEAVKDMSVEEIADLLKDVGITPTGKRQALIAKLVKAVEEGKIEWDSSEEDSEPDEEEDEEEDYFPDDMTDVRAEAIGELEKELRAEYKKKKISDKEITEGCEAFYLEHEGFDKKLPKGEQLDMYIAATQRMVDDEGEQHEFQEPYEMNGIPACCGHYLKELEDGNLYCPVCSQEYEAE